MQYPVYMPKVTCELILLPAQGPSVWHLGPPLQRLAASWPHVITGSNMHCLAEASCPKAITIGPIVLQSWRPSKEVLKPRPGKVPKKCFGKCRSKNGVPGKVPKKCSALRAYVEVAQETGPGALVSALSSAPRFGPALSEAFCRHSSCPELRDFFRWPPGL